MLRIKYVYLQTDCWNTNDQGIPWDILGAQGGGGNNNDEDKDTEIKTLEDCIENKRNQLNMFYDGEDVPEVDNQALNVMFDGCGCNFSFNDDLRNIISLFEAGKGGDLQNALEMGNLDCTKLKCMINNEDVQSYVSNLLSEDITYPCNPGMTTSDLVNGVLSEAIASGNCSVQKFETALQGIKGIKTS